MNEQLSNMANEDKQHIESDVEPDDSDARSNVTTDEEFYNELMSAPDEREVHLIPDECKDEITGIEHMTTSFQCRYNSCPVVFTGTLKDAIQESFHSKDRRPLLIYINNDKSVYSNLFCQQLLSHEKIIEYLLHNYVLWTWDVTYPSNGKKLNEIYKNAFSQWNVDQQIGMKTTEQYPLLIGVSRHSNGDYLFRYLINGQTDRPIIDEFLARLIQHRDQFEIEEDQLEREKNRVHEMSHLSHHPSNYQVDRSLSMHPHTASPFTRFFSSDHQRIYSNVDTFLPHIFQRLNTYPDENDADEEEEEDDDHDRTPTVTRLAPKYPRE